MGGRLSGSRLISILLADDDEEDLQLTTDALRANRLANEIRAVRDGEELMDYLLRRGQYTDAPTPGLVLLDLNMPKKDGREALAEIKANPELRKIPVIVLTTSKAEEDIFRSYDLGVNSFITKPVTFAGLAEAMKVMARFWFEIVELPSRTRAWT
jgi:CheY-like chemotaxis protein